MKEREAILGHQVLLPGVWLVLLCIHPGLRNGCWAEDRAAAEQGSAAYGTGARTSSSTLQGYPLSYFIVTLLACLSLSGADDGVDRVRQDIGHLGHVTGMRIAAKKYDLMGAEGKGGEMIEVVSGGAAAARGQALGGCAAEVALWRGSRRMQPTTRSGF